MKVVLASTNQAKIAAAQRASEAIFGSVEVVTVESESGVSATPKSDDEGIRGCLNRIEGAKTKVEDGDVYIALEGIVATNSFGMFVCGWAVVEIARTKQQGIGCSAKVRIPEFVAREALSFAELGKLVRQIYPSQLTAQMDAIGSNGIITKNMYNRVDEFEDAIRCALGYALNETNHGEVEVSSTER